MRSRILNHRQSRDLTSEFTSSTTPSLSLCGRYMRASARVCEFVAADFMTHPDEAMAMIFYYALLARCHSQCALARSSCSRMQSPHSSSLSSDTDNLCWQFPGGNFIHRNTLHIPLPAKCPPRRRVRDLVACHESPCSVWRAHGANPHQGPLAVSPALLLYCRE